MKIIIFLVLIICVTFASISIAQEEKPVLSKERIEILEKKVLFELQSPKDFFAVSKDKIIAVVNNANLGYGNKVIKIITNGKEINRIEENNCKIFKLSFSGDGNWLSYGIRKRGEVANIKIYNMINCELKNIDNTGKECANLSFSPDSKKFVFSRKVDEGWRTNIELVISDFDGNQKVIVNNANFPKWSPTGDRIAFHRGEQIPGLKGWVGYIWIYNINAREEIKLFNSKGMTRYTMSWSPNGTKIASHNGHNLGIINIDSDQRINIGSIEAHHPSWSPDGLKIAFIQPILKQDISEILEDSEIYIANSDGTNLINLSNTPKISEDKIIWLNRNQIIFKITGDSGISKLQEFKF